MIPSFPHSKAAELQVQAKNVLGAERHSWSPALVELEVQLDMKSCPAEHEMHPPHSYKLPSRVRENNWGYDITEPNLA